MLPARVQLQLGGVFPRRLTEGEAIEISVKDASPVGSLYPWWIQYKLFIVDGHNRTVWVQADIFDLENHSRFEFFLPEEFIKYQIQQQDRRFKIGVIALDSRFGSRPVTSSAAYSPSIWLRSLEEVAAEQLAEQMKIQNAAAAAAAAADPANAANGATVDRTNGAAAAAAATSPISAPVRKIDNEDGGDESGSDDSGSELPSGSMPTTGTNGMPFPRTFEEYRKYWGIKLKDIAAQFGVPESGVSKGWKRACSRHFHRNTNLPRWPATEERIRDLEKLLAGKGRPLH